jgi:histidine triad (HIT) family protein
MYNHIPEGYICPFCLIVEGIENEHLYTKQSDIVYKDEFVTAFIASCWW